MRYMPTNTPVILRAFLPMGVVSPVQTVTVPTDGFLGRDMPPVSGLLDGLGFAGVFFWVFLVGMAATLGDSACVTPCDSQMSSFPLCAVALSLLVSACNAISVNMPARMPL